jgi:hypothetical protein
VKESDSGGTLPDHEDLVDHHQLHHDPTVPPGSCPSIVGTSRRPTVSGTTRPDARRRSAMNLGSLTTPRSMATGTQCGGLCEFSLAPARLTILGDKPGRVSVSRFRGSTMPTSPPSVFPRLTN